MAGRFATWYLNLLESNPYTTKGFTTGIVKALSDVTGQLTVDGRVGNYRSAYSKLVFGILVDAPYWHLSYKYMNHLSMRVVGSSQLLRTAVSTLIDQVLATPFFYIIWYYGIGILEGQPITDIRKQLKAELVPTILAAWRVWPFYTFLQMYFIPEPLWIPVGNVVSFIFSFYLKLREYYYKKARGNEEGEKTLQNIYGPSSKVSQIQGSCSCGAIKYKGLPHETQKCIWGIFICHCSQCPVESRIWHDSALKEDYGAPWVAIPKPSFTSVGESFEKLNLSSFAERGVCKKCGDSIYIQYNCEENTTWVLLNTLKPKLALKPPLIKLSHGESKRVTFQHIHCNNTSKIEVDSQGIPIHSDFGRWEPDPCRDVNEPIPNVCYTCWQLKGKHCKCE